MNHTTHSSSVNHPTHSPNMNQQTHSPIEFYMDGSTNSLQNTNYMRQFPFEMFDHSKRARFDSNETLEPELSRATHNVLERQRRNDLKLRFTILRDNIPELANNEKAPKIQILKKGLEFLTFLKREEQMLLADKELEKQKKIILMERLKMLQHQQ
jgi:Helix-loop-helix DNA-binding domain.